MSLNREIHIAMMPPTDHSDGANGELKKSSLSVVERGGQPIHCKETELRLGVFATVETDGVRSELAARFATLADVTPLDHASAVIMGQREVSGSQWAANRHGFSFVRRFGDATKGQLDAFGDKAGGEFILGKALVIADPTDRKQPTRVAGYELRPLDHVTSPAATLRTHLIRPLQDIVTRTKGASRNEDVRTLRQPHLFLPVAMMHDPEVTAVANPEFMKRGNEVFGGRIALGPVVTMQDVGFPIPGH